VPQITVQELNAAMERGAISVLDVRREPEWQAGHVAAAELWPLDKFRSEPPSLSKASVAVHCKSGYRSIIACSLLKRAGYEDVVNVIGGFDAWQQADLPVAVGTAVGA